MAPSIIECISCIKGTDKNGKEYTRLFFRNYEFLEITNPETGEIRYARVSSPVGHINQYREGYTSSHRPDIHFDCKEGDLVTGRVVQREVEPYTTEKGYTINYYNCVVFGDNTKSDWESKVRTAFQKEGKRLLPDAVHPRIEVIAPEKEIVNQELEKVKLNF